MKGIWFLIAAVTVIVSQFEVSGQIFVRKQSNKIVKAKRNNGTESAAAAAVASAAAAAVVAAHGFQDGQYMTIIQSASGKYLTIEAGPNKNVTHNSPNVIVQDWNDEDSQKWLALLVTPRVHQHRRVQHARDANVVQSRYVLVSKRQSYPNEGKNYTLDTLPPLTEVLTLDSLTGNLTTEVYQRGSSSQQWIAEAAAPDADSEGGRIVIRNLGNDQCIKNFDYKPASIFQKIGAFIHRLRQPYKPKPAPQPLSTLDCSGTDASQKWICERI